MRNSISEQSFYIESEEEDDEQEKHENEEEGNESDFSNYSNENDDENNRQQSKPNSLASAWPQSYRYLYIFTFSLNCLNFIRINFISTLLDFGLVCELMLM